MKKLIIIFLVLTLFIPLSACNGQNNQNNKSDIEVPAVDISTTGLLDGTLINLDRQFDETENFSYVTYMASNKAKPYIENNIEFPDNIFIYEATASSTDDVTMYGYMNENFEMLSHPISLSPNAFSMGMAIIDGEDGLYIVNRDFENVVELCDGYVLIDNGLIKVSQGSNTPEQIIILTIKNPDTYLVPVKVDTGSFSKEGKIYNYGYKTVTKFLSGDKADENSFIVQPVFEDARPFFNGLAAVKLDGKWGYIDDEGNIIIDFFYIHAGDFIESSTFVFLGNYVKADENDKSESQNRVLEGNWGLIDSNGVPLTQFEFGYADSFHEGWAAVYYGNSSNYINTRGENLLEESIQGLAFLGSFENGVAVVLDVQNGLQHFYDSNGVNLFTLDIANTVKFSDGLAAIKKDGRYTYIDQTGNTVIDENFMSVSDFNNGYAFVVKNFNRPGFIIDKFGNRYLEELNISGMTKFNDEGYALAYTIINKNEATQNRLYYMIHVENN